MLDELAQIARVGSGDQPLLQARAEIHREGNEYVLLLTTVRDGDTRDKQVRAPQCATLQHMATLILGLALGDSVELIINDQDQKADADAEPTEETEPAATSVPAPPAADVAPQREDPKLDAGPTAPPVTSSEKARPRFVVFGALATNFGLLPEPSLGPALGAAFVPRPKIVPSLGLSLTGLWPVAKTSVQPGITASFFALAARAEGCWALAHGDPELAACPLALSAGALFAESSGAARDERVVAPWYAWTPSVRLSLDLSRDTRMRLEPMAVFSPFDTQFRIAPEGEVHTVPYWSASVELGVELDVPD